MPSRPFLCFRIALAALVPIAAFAQNGTVIVLCIIALGVPSFAAVKMVLRRWFATYFGVALIGLCLWMALTAGHAIDPAESMEQAVRLLALLAVAIVAAATAEGLTADQARTVLRDAALALAAVVALVLLELATDGLILRHVKDYASEYTARGIQATVPEYISWRVHNALGRAGVILIAMGPFVLLGIAGRSRMIAVAGAAAAMAAIFLLPIAAAKVAVPAALVAAAIAIFAPRTVLWFLCFGGLVTILAFPWTALEIDPALPFGYSPKPLGMSMEHRFQIWHFAAERITEKPWFGWGLESSRDVPGANQEVTLSVIQNGVEIVDHNVIMPLHPHDTILQIWLEGGVVAALLFGGVIVGLTQMIENLKSTRSVQIAAIAAVVGLAPFAYASFGAWQDWWLATLVLAGLMTRVSIRARPDPAAP